MVAALTGWGSIRRLERLIDRFASRGRLRGQDLLARLARDLDVPSRARQADLTVRTMRAGLEVAWVRLTSGDLLATDGVVTGPAELSVPLVAGEMEVGRLEAGPRHGGWTPAETAEVALLARHAGLALHNSDLSARLATQVTELQASRHRIVTAELEARRGLERDLHDGVQQQVVAMIAHLGALAVLVPPGSAEAKVVQTTQQQARLCLSGLRELVDGVQPPVLLDQGLVVAVESRAALLPLPVRVRAVDRGRRYPPDIEAAAWYLCSELLTNVVKHAAARRAEVEIVGTGAELRLTVRDDGVGMPAGQTLRRLRDRVEALSGELQISGGEPGTCVSVRLPTDDV